MAKKFSKIFENGTIEYLVKSTDYKILKNNKYSEEKINTENLFPYLRPTL